MNNELLEERLQLVTEQIVALENTEEQYRDADFLAMIFANRWIIPVWATNNLTREAEKLARTRTETLDALNGNAAGEFDSYTQKIAYHYDRAPIIVAQLYARADTDKGN